MVSFDPKAVLTSPQATAGQSLHHQDQDVTAESESLSSQLARTRHEANALWNAIEVNYSTQTESDLVSVPWRHETKPRSVWRQQLASLNGNIAQFEKRQQELSVAHDSVHHQIRSILDDTLQAARLTYSTEQALTPTDAEYLSQGHVQLLASFVSDWEAALQANTTLQHLLPQISISEAQRTQTQMDLELQRFEWQLHLAPTDNDAAHLKSLQPHTPLQEMRQSLLLAQYTIQTIHTHVGKLDSALHLLESVLAHGQADHLDDAEVATLTHALYFHTALAASKGAEIRATQGSAAFNAYYNGLQSTIDSMETRFPSSREAFAATRLQLVRVQWAAHHYQDAFSSAARLQRHYVGTDAVKELDAPESWLYRARPEAYAPDGLIRENLSEVSFEGLGAAYREAWAHTTENSMAVQYALPTLGCVAGAALVSKFGAVAGTTVGPEGTVLGFGAGAATGCGVGAATGKIIDWATSAITAPEVAQALVTGYSDNNLGMTWVQMNFAAADLAFTYLTAKTVWKPALGLAQGTVDIGAIAYNFGKYAITQPGAALADLGTGLLTTARVSTAVAQTLAQSLITPVTTTKAILATIRLNATHAIDALRAMSMESYAQAASVAGTMTLAAATLYPDTASANDRSHPATKTKFESMWEAAKKPGALEWALSVPVFLFGTWAAARMLWLDKILVKPLVWNAFRNEARANAALKILQGGQMSFKEALFQACLVNAPWVYQQMEANNVKPFKMSVGSFSDVAYVVGSMVSRAIVQHRTGRPISAPVNGPFVDWLRKKNIFDVKTPVLRDYPLFWALNVLSSQLNNQTFGLYFTDAKPKPWIQRNMVQPLPMFPRKFVALSLGLNSYGGMFVDWALNTYENRMLSWFFPPWAGKKNWADDFNKFDANTTWDAMVTHFDSKMERGTLQKPEGNDTVPWGRRLHEMEFSDFYSELSKGSLELAAVSAIAQKVIDKADPKKFAQLSPIEKRLVLIHLAMFSKLPVPQAQDALTPYLKVMGFESMEALTQAPIEEVIEHLNSQKF